MTIKNKIDLLKQYRNDIENSIKLKGVPVPNGTKLQGMSTLIDKIESANDILKNGTNKLTIQFPKNFYYKLNKSVEKSIIRFNHKGTFEIYLEINAQALLTKGTLKVILKKENGNRKVVFEDTYSTSPLSEFSIKVDADVNDEIIISVTNDAHVYFYNISFLNVKKEFFFDVFP